MLIVEKTLRFARFGADRVKTTSTVRISVFAASKAGADHLSEEFEPTPRENLKALLSIVSLETDSNLNRD